MKRTTKFAILATVTAAMLGSVAIADGHKKERAEMRGDRAERMFERLDADTDGKVTADEMKAAATARFAKRDVDGDGVVSREDRKAFRAAQREERRSERFEKMDADSDGMISKEEFAAFTPERGDRAERRKMRRAERGERRGMRGHHGGKRGERHGNRRGKGMRGPLTIQEAEARAMQRFQRIDSDAKGYITLNDIKAFRADRKDRRGRD